ncbi:MAG: DNA translocase FtsK 4TM domain-containing protein, partial [Lacrimispora sphenoides]
MPETTKKRTTAKKGKNGRTRNTAAKKNVILPEPEFIHSEVVIIMSFLAAAILFFSNFHLCGVVGDFLRSLQLGIFGSVGYVAPVLLFAGTAFYISNQGNPRAAFKLASFILALVSLCGFLQLLFGAKAGEGIGLADIYFEASVSGRGGGIIGGLLAGGLASIIGVVGAYLVIGVLLVISLVCITEKSFVDIVKKGSGKAYRHARENMDMHMEVHAMRQEARKQLLEEKKLRGVNLEATKLEEAQEESYVEEQVEEAPDNLADDIMVQAKRLSAVTAVEEDELNPADIFRGSFSPVLEDDEDSVPFAPDAEGTPFAEALEEPSIYMKKEIKTLKELEFVEDDFYPEEGNDTFAIPEEPKQVVTASGKVIETDTEALQKKLEKKREEAAKEDGGSVSLEIKQKQEIVKPEYKFPPLSLLKKGKSAVFSDREYKDTAIKLQRTLQNFGVGVTVTNISCGPSVTRYELHPEQGVKVSKIVSLADDIKLSLAAADIRIEAPIPGKSAVGIEVPNKENQMVYLRDILEADSFQKHS